MDRVDFENEINRLKEQYGDHNYGAERTELFWNQFQMVDAHEFKEAVTFFIMSTNKAPLMEDLYSRMKAAIDDAFEKKIKDMPDCSLCQKKGTYDYMRWYRSNENPYTDDDKWHGHFAMAQHRCHCLVGQELNSRNYTDFPSLKRWNYDPVFQRCLVKLDIAGYYMGGKNPEKWFQEYGRLGSLTFENSVNSVISNDICPGDDTQYYNPDDNTYSAVIKIANKDYRKDRPILKEQLMDQMKWAGGSIRVVFPDGLTCSIIKNEKNPDNLRDVIFLAGRTSLMDVRPLRFYFFTKKSVKKFYENQVLNVKFKVVQKIEPKKVFPFEVVSIKET